MTTNPLRGTVGFGFEIDDVGVCFFSASRGYVNQLFQTSLWAAICYSLETFGFICMWALEAGSRGHRMGIVWVLLSYHGRQESAVDGNFKPAFEFWPQSF